MPKVTTYAPPPPREPGSNDFTQAAYWRLERQLLQQEFTDITMQIILAGAEAGVNDLPPGLDVLVDWDVFNQSALDWMRQYLSLDPRYMGNLGGGAYSWVNQLTDTTRRTVMREIDNWVREGAALPVLEARLKPVFGEQRARRVAVTEVTRIYAEGNLKAWQSTGVVTGKRWLTAVDERVCPICGPMHNTIVDFEGNWNFTPEMLANNPQLEKALRSLGVSTFRAPPAHVNCRCWLQPVLYEYQDKKEIDRNRFNA